MVEAINKVNSAVVQQNVVTQPKSIQEDADLSIFLEESLSHVNDKQGCIGKSWNDLKEGLNVGLTSSDCEKAINDYKNGKISYEEAMEKIATFDNKQSTITDLIANITTGIASIALVTAFVSGGPIGWGLALLLGAPIGAACKAGVKFIDRATNNLFRDEYDKKLIAKDIITGAVTGATSAVSSGIGAGIKAGKMSLSVKNGTKCGAICGGVAGATSYLADVALDKDKYFNLGELAASTITSAAVSASVGGVVGASVFKISSPATYTAQSVNRIIVNDSIASSSRKVLGNMEKETLGVARA